MAVANVPASTAKVMDEARREREGMNSPDPTVRYLTRERAFDRAFTEFGSVLVQNAKRNAKEIRKIEENEAYSLHY